MDIALLAGFLCPFLPFLVKFGEKASEEAGKKFGEDAWAKAKAIWGQLASNPAVQQSAEQVAAKPDSTKRQDVFQEDLEAALQDDPKLAQEIARILQEATPGGIPGMQIVQTVTGDRAQAIGQMTNSTAVGNVERNSFVISGGSITNLVGEGTINYQEGGTAEPPAPGTTQPH
jgi:transketolase